MSCILIDAPIQEIVDAFETYGRPWAEKKASVPAIREELNGVLSLNTRALACRRIAVELVRGDRDSAWVALDAARTDAASRESDATAYLALVATWAENLEAIIDGLDDR